MALNEDAKRAIALKIKALLAKTTEAGCSEAEALAAAHKAHELLAKYQLDLSELDLREEGTSETEVTRSVISRELAMRVGKYCEVKCWENSKEGKVKFLGLQSDAFFAEWLLMALTSFVQRKTLDYSLAATKIYQGEVEEFQIGCIHRINARLKAEVDLRDAQRASAALQGKGTSLMVIKNALITEAWAKKNLTLGRGESNRGTNAASQHYTAGHNAGGDARFSRPVARDEFAQRALPGTRAKS